MGCLKISHRSDLRLFLVALASSYALDSFIYGNSFDSGASASSASSVVMVLQDCAKGPYYYGVAQEMRQAWAEVTGGPYMCYSLFYGYLTYQDLQEYDFDTVMDWLGLHPSQTKYAFRESVTVLQDFIRHGHRLWLNIGPTLISKEDGIADSSQEISVDVLPGVTLHRQRSAYQSTEVGVLGEVPLWNNPNAWHEVWLEIDSQTQFKSLIYNDAWQRTLLAQGTSDNCSKSIVLSTLSPQQLNDDQHIRTQILTWLHDGTSLQL